MQALLLAAGRSRRFQPLGDKNFLKLGNKFLVEQQVEILKKAGIQKTIIIGGKHNIKQLKALFPKATVLEQKSLNQGMAGAVLTAEKHLNAPTLIVSTNDVIEASAIKKVIGSKNCDGAILAQRVKEYFPGGYLKTSGKKIINIVEKPKPGKEPSDFVNIVCHFFQKPQALVTELKKVSNKKDDGYEQALGKLFKKQKFIAVQNTSKWQAVKYPWHALDLAQNFLKSIKKTQISPKAQIAKTAVINGNVIIEEGVKIFDYAIINGNVFLGKNSIVGNHSLVRDSVVGENSVVGSGTEVARSYLAENVWLHRNYVGDSIVSGNVSFGSGVVCANLRLDEGEIKSIVGKDKRIFTKRNKFGCAVGQACRIGVNTSIMPGVLIGENSFIGSGLIVDKNLPSQSFYNAEWKTKLVKNKKVIKPRKSFIK